jgi:hypothetical protein
MNSGVLKIIESSDCSNDFFAQNRNSVNRRHEEIGVEVYRVILQKKKDIITQKHIFLFHASHYLHRHDTLLG